MKKKEFKMTQKEMDGILKINKEHFRPVLKIGDHWTGGGLQEKVFDYWETLAKKYSFINGTAEASTKGKLYFLAEPKEVKK